MLSSPNDKYISKSSKTSRNENDCKVLHPDNAPNDLVTNPLSRTESHCPNIQSASSLQQGINKNIATKNSRFFSHLPILLWHRSRAQTTQHGSVEMSDHWEASEFEHARGYKYVAMALPATHKNGSFIPGVVTLGKATQLFLAWKQKYLSLRGKGIVFIGWYHIQAQLQVYLCLSPYESLWMT